MDAKFIFAIIFAIIAALSVLVFFLARRSKRVNLAKGYSENSDTVEVASLFKTGGRIVAIGAGAISLLLVILSSFTIVPTKEVGIVTSFGTPVAHLSNGLHAVRPWAKITHMSATIQTNNHVDEGDTKEAISVRLGNNSTARANVTISWRIREEAAPSLFQDYNGDNPLNNVKDNLVTRELTAALNDVLSTFDPLASMITSENGAPTTTPAAGAGANNAKFASDVADKLRKKVGDRVDIIGVNIPTIDFDKRTQDSINNLGIAIAETRNAEQRAKTAAKEKEANDTLASSVQNENVLRSKCLDIAREKNQPILGCMNIGAGTIVSPK